MRSLSVALSLALASTLGAQAPDASAAAVPVQDEPLHKTVLKNAYIQAFRVQVSPGQATGWHIHAHDDAAVLLGRAVIADQRFGAERTPADTTTLGQVSARELTHSPLTHRAFNVGTTLFDVIDVQVLARPEGPTSAPLKMPDAENASMRVYRYELEPGADAPAHTHARPYLLVAATDITLRMTSPDGQVMEHSPRAGDMHWMELPVAHTLTNRGAKKAILVEIEIK